MKYVTKQFTEKNINEVLALIKQSNNQQENIFSWDAGRFIDWFYSLNQLQLVKQPDWFSSNCTLFYADSKLELIVLSESGEKDTAIISPKLQIEMLTDIWPWLEKNWIPQRKGISFEFDSKANWLNTFLDEKGLSREDNSGHEWEYDLSVNRQTRSLPEDFRIADFTEGNRIIHGASDVSRQAFDLDESLDDINLHWKKYSTNPMFENELNICIVSKNGTVASYCRGTVDTQHGIAGIDPVCTLPGFEGKGLAAAAVEECFKRLAERGAKKCYIGSAPMPAPSTYLYKKLQPASYTSCVYRELNL